MDIVDILEIAGSGEQLKRTELEILQDYVVIGEPRVGALIHRDANPKFVQGVKAAILAGKLGISIQHAQREYLRDTFCEEPDLPERWVHFQQAYFLAMDHLKDTLSRFRSEGKPEPPAGVVFADAALRRLVGTFYSAGMLYRTGYLFEARCVARMILEQVAWAYAVRTTEDTQVAAKQSVTGSIGVLKNLLPSVGKLYGYLSAKTHLGVSEHYEFLDAKKTWVRMTHGANSLGGGVLLLDLADFWSVVYEITQEAYMDDFENWAGRPGKMHLRADRPFLAQARSIKQIILGTP